LEIAMALEDWKKLRQQWVKARDSAKPKVEKGAVKGVSVGDAIDNVTKASLKGHLPLAKAIQDLQKDLDKYKAGIKSKNKDLVDWLEKNVEKPADDLMSDLSDDVANLEVIKREMQLFKSRTDLHFPDGEEFHKVGMKAKKDGVTWQVASKDLFTRLGKSLLVWNSMNKAVSACAKEMKVPLPVKPGHAELKKLADDFDHEIKLVGSLLKTQSLDDFQTQAKSCRDSFYMLCLTAESTSKAIAKLLP
jgi:hypothetical protein